MKKLVFAIAISILFTACTGVPFQESSGKLANVSFASNEQVFNCAIKFIDDQTKENSKLTYKGEKLTVGGWSNNITKKDVPNGIIEIGDFKKENGVKVYVAQVKINNKNININVRSTAPYYASKKNFNTGVDEALNEIKTNIYNCLKMEIK